MGDTKTTDEATRTPIDGSELVRLATSGANWKATLAAINNTLAAEKLTADRTYFVAPSPTGNDANDGLTVGTPFLTIQHAIDTVYGLYLNGHFATIKLAAGSYSESLLIAGRFPGMSINSGGVVIQGDNTTPANVVMTGATPFYIEDCIIQLEGMKFSGCTQAITSVFNSVVFITNKMDFGALAVGGVHLSAVGNSQIFIQSDYAISGGGLSHWWCGQLGQLTCSDRTITISGSPTFSYFAKCEGIGIIDAERNTFTNGSTVNAARFYLAANSNLYVDPNDLSPAYLPGNAPGVMDGNSSYNIGQRSITLREILSGDRTYYVRSDGSDANDGLANTSARAFLTYAKAILAAAQLDGNGYNVTISIQNTTWTAQFNIGLTFIGIATLIIDFNGGALTVASGVAFVSTASQTALIILKRVTISGGSNGIEWQGAGALQIDTVSFGAIASSHMSISAPGYIYIIGDYTISGSASVHCRSIAAGATVFYYPGTVTFSGATTFASAFVSGNSLGYIESVGVTFAGTMPTSTPRYGAAGNSVIYTGGSGSTYFPGDIGGTTSTGGQYL